MHRIKIQRILIQLMKRLIFLEDVTNVMEPFIERNGNKTFKVFHSSLGYMEQMAYFLVLTMSFFDISCENCQSSYLENACQHNCCIECQRWKYLKGQEFALMIKLEQVFFSWKTVSNLCFGEERNVLYMTAPLISMT
jgi:hypothetical protein